MNEQKAIELGKEWMKKSKDPIHGYEHAENVAKYSLEVFKSLKEEGWEIDSEIDESLILICAWWHDCFKALFEKKTFLNEIFEGIRSAEIAQEELKNLVSEKRLSLIALAIKNHNNIPYFFFSGKRMPTLTRILIEADAIDAKDKERKKKRNLSPRTLFHKIIVFFAEPTISLLQRIYIKSPYAKKCLWS
jgi:hypothetical protein